jgi:hypothetical protein
MSAPRSLLGRLRRRAILEVDIRRLRRRHGAAFAGGAADGPVALIASLTEFVYQLKLEGILGSALRLEEWKPVALVPEGSWIPRKYFSAFGIESFVHLADFLDADAEAEARAEADRILASRPSVADLRGLSYRNAAIGRHVLSTISRATHDGAVDLDQPRARAALADLLPTTLASTLAAERLLDALEPRLVLFLERNYAAEAPLSDLALERGIDVVQFVSGPQDDSLVFKRYTKETRRLHPRSLSAESWRLMQNLPWTPEREHELDAEFRRRYDNSWALGRRLQGWTRDQPREAVLRSLGLDPAKKTAVVYSHILWDANMFYGEDLFADQEEWFVETVRTVCANDAVNWLLKLHPANVWKARRERLGDALDEEIAIREKIGSLPSHVAVLRPDSDVSTASVFALTDWGITIRGSIGFELPCFGVPVLTAGTGFYSGLGFTIDSATRDDYLHRLRTIETIPPLAPEQVELARRHAYALFKLRPLRFTSFEATIRPLAQMGHPLDHDVELKIGTRAQLEAAPDLRRFARWATQSRELDYLEPVRADGREEAVSLETTPRP